jgi:hypothetical protein
MFSLPLSLTILTYFPKRSTAFSSAALAFPLGRAGGMYERFFVAGGNGANGVVLLS